MSQPRIHWLLVVTALAASACSKGETKPASTEGSASPAAASTCSASHTTVSDGGFCIDVPKDWKLTPETRSDITDFRWSGKDVGLTVTLDRKKKALPGDVSFTPRKGEAVTKGDFAGGKGKWALMLGSGGDMDLDSSYRVEVLGPNGVLSCNGSTSNAKAKQAADLCKSIVPLGP